MIANRQVDVWEMAYVWAWELKLPSRTPKRTRNAKLDELESHVYWDLIAKGPLVSGKVPPKLPAPLAIVPPMVKVQVIPPDEVKARQEPALRFPRQIQHFNQLVDYILNTQDKPHLRKALEVYHDRLTRYFRAFMKT